MLSKITSALALAVVAASGALAATKQQSFQPPHDVYDARDTCVGSDPDRQRALGAAAGLGSRSLTKRKSGQPQAPLSGSLVGPEDIDRRSARV
jgi:hypothetical protein